MKQFGQRGGPRLVETSPEGHFDGFQIEAPGLAMLGKDAGEQTVYFPRDLLMDCISRFFSSAVKLSVVAGRGRVSQICWLTSTSSRLSCSKFLYSAISFSTFSSDARSGRVSVWVLPLTL